MLIFLSYRHSSLVLQMKLIEKVAIDLGKDLVGLLLLN